MKLEYKILTYITLIVSVFITSCEDQFLERPPLTGIATDNFYQTKGDLDLATAALYAGSPWGDWTYSSYLPIGEVMSGNMALNYNGDAIQLNTFSVTGYNGALISNWKGMYNIIGHCNITINAINDKAPSTIAQEDINASLSEAKFIRAYAYFNLAMLWGDVPIIEDNAKLVKSPLIYRNEVNDVYQFIVNDLTFAAHNLPEMPSAKGRISKWSAQGLLSKVYLTWSGLGKTVGFRDQAKLDSAVLYAGNVCKTSGLTLMDNYADLFKSQNNDNDEALFSLQWEPSVGDWLVGNMLQIYSPGGTEISANGQAGWYSIAPTYDIFKNYSAKDTVRRKATFMLRNDHYPELNAAGGGYTYKGDGGLKKHIIGTKEDNNVPIMTLTSSAEHNALLRLSDVYLVYAEAIMGNSTSTSNADALLYYNLVRSRAGVDPVAIIQEDELMNERRIELAAEGHYWFDLVRLSYYNPQKAISMLNNQERVLFAYSAGVATPNDPIAEITPATINTFKLPIPSSEVTANPNFLKAAVPYF
jgi:starch-binding outer membrane protein, SusD/RagB family